MMSRVKHPIQGPQPRLSPQSSVLSPQPSVLSPQPSALSPQPSALSPQPSALSPQPSALSPQPSALSPQPSALSPQPSALSPQPSALSPQPSALSPEEDVPCFGPPANHFVPALPAFARLLRACRAREEDSLSAKRVLGTASARLRRSSRPRADSRARTGCTWRKPYGPRVHRRRLSRFSHARHASRWIRQHPDIPRRRRWTSTEGCVHPCGRTVRPARQQANITRDRELPVTS